MADEILKSSDADYNRLLKRRREQNEANIDGRPRCNRDGRDLLLDALKAEAYSKVDQ